MTTDARQLLVLLDDAALMPSVVDLSSSVARGLSRPLELVYVESVLALQAAALPFAQVLSHGGSRWQPFAPQDVERAYQVQASRLRQLAERVAVQHAVQWSMRVMRGALADAALQMRQQADLVLVACASGEAAAPPRRAAMGRKRRQAITVITDDSPAAARAVQVARQLAQANDALLTVRHGGTDAALRAVGAEACDLLVLPGALASAQTLRQLRRPALLVD